MLSKACTVGSLGLNPGKIGPTLGQSSLGPDPGGGFRLGQRSVKSPFRSATDGTN